MELITLVDIDDQITGYETKEAVHQKGLLHRAFSIYIIHDGKMLIQKRAEDKYHSGGLWTNACCSHQRQNELLEEAIHRRLLEELGFDCELEEQFSFIYRTVFAEDLYEYELDHVFVGDYDGDIHLNPEEASEMKWISLCELKDDLARNPHKYTSWFIISAPRVMNMLSMKE